MEKHGFPFMFRKHTYLIWDRQILKVCYLAWFSDISTLQTKHFLPKSLIISHITSVSLFHGKKSVIPSVQLPDGHSATHAKRFVWNGDNEHLDRNLTRLHERTEITRQASFDLGKKFWLFYWCKIKVQSIIKNLSFKIICLCFLMNARQGTSASGARHIRIWEEAHPYLGGDAPVSGTWNDRIWDLKRLNARRCSPTNRDTKFSCCFFYDCCLVKLILIERYISRQKLSRPPLPVT